MRSPWAVERPSAATASPTESTPQPFVRLAACLSLRHLAVLAAIDGMQPLLRERVTAVWLRGERRDRALGWSGRLSCSPSEPTRDLRARQPKSDESDEQKRPKDRLLACTVHGHFPSEVCSSAPPGMACWRPNAPCNVRFPILDIRIPQSSPHHHQAPSPAVRNGTTVLPPAGIRAPIFQRRCAAVIDYRL